MTSENESHPANRNVRETPAQPPSKRPRREFKTEPTQRWSLTTGQNDLAALAEMGLAMLDSDDISEFKNENDIRQASSSKATFEHNDTNPDLIVPSAFFVPNLSDDSVDSLSTTLTLDRLGAEARNELLKQSKNWENFCIYRRSCMMSQDTKDWFNHLSDEIMLLIFRWLPKPSLTSCGLVCKRWYRLTSDESLWTKLDCTAKVLDKGTLGHILSKQVIVLKLAQAEIIHPPIEYGVKASNKDFVAKLMFLDLSMATALPESLELFLSKCTRLRKISLESCLISDGVCKQLARNLNLEVLNLAMAMGLEAKGIEYITSGCKLIKELNVAWTGLSVDAVGILCSTLPKNLSRFNLSGCRNTLQVNHVRNIVRRSPNLRELDLSDGTNLTNEAIRYISALTELNFLSISRCYGIQCNAVKKLTAVNSLQFLDIHGGHIEQAKFEELRVALGNRVQLNKYMFSSIARPTVGLKRSSIWQLRVRD